MIIVKLHPGDVWVRRGTHPERGHAAAVHVQGAVREEVQEQAVVGLIWVCNVL